MNNAVQKFLLHEVAKYMPLKMLTIDIIPPTNQNRVFNNDILTFRIL